MATRKWSDSTEYLEYWERRNAYLQRSERWRLALNNLSPGAKRWISQVLAALDLEPDEKGRPVPHANIPKGPKTDPLVVLDAWEGRRIVGTDYDHSTNAWRADVLAAATLVASGMDLTEAYELAYTRLAHWTDVLRLCEEADLARFWRRRGVGLSLEEAARAIVDGDLVIDEGFIERAMRRRKRRAIPTD